MEVWARKAAIDSPSSRLVLHADQRLLVVTIALTCGVVQFVNAHALDSSYPPDQVNEWWRALDAKLAAVLSPNHITFGLIRLMPT